MEANTTEQHPSCVSLGMVILDEIRMPHKPPLLDIIGGSATFVTLGLRLFATDSLRPGCLVLAGSDFPRSIRAEMQSWGCNPPAIVDVAGQPSSRGLLTYEDDTFGPKTFEYTTPPLRALPRHLVGTRLLSTQAFHFFGRPGEIVEQVPELLSHRAHAHPELPRPFIVWEPLPASFAPENMDAFREACALVDVFSPNHLELAALLAAEPVADADADAGAHALQQLSAHGAAFLTALSPSTSAETTVPAPVPTLVLRAGALGALALRTQHPPLHTPAFFPPGSSRVVDVTGAGNAFLGGYVAGWLREGSVRGAMECGAVAAGCAVEQIGIPGNVDGVGDARLREYRKQLEGPRGG